jgi:hypothetical protein
MANFIDKLSPEARKAFEQASQKLRDNEVQMKADSYGPQIPARRADPYE